MSDETTTAISRGDARQYLEVMRQMPYAANIVPRINLDTLTFGQIIDHMGELAARLAEVGKRDARQSIELAEAKAVLKGGRDLFAYLSRQEG
jgi:hypothetical protein